MYIICTESSCVSAGRRHCASGSVECCAYYGVLDGTTAVRIACSRIANRSSWSAMGTSTFIKGTNIRIKGTNIRIKGTNIRIKSTSTFIKGCSLPA